jgi:hypothetical protein
VYFSQRVADASLEAGAGLGASQRCGTTPGASQIGAGPGPEGADTGVAGLDGDEIHEKTFERGVSQTSYDRVAAWLNGNTYTAAQAASEADGGTSLGFSRCIVPQPVTM